MILHNIKKTGLALLLTTVVFSSCSEDVMDRINEDRNNPADAPARFLIPQAITASAFSVTGSDYAFYSSVYMESQAGIFGQMYDAELRTATTSSSTYNNSWNSTYANIWNLRTIIAKCSPGGKEYGNTQALGVAQVLLAYNLAIQTDLMGDIPYAESGQPGVIFQPKIDKQEVLYAEIMKSLDEGIVNLDKTTSPVFPELEGMDLLFNGDNKSWKKMAYGLKARYKMRLSLKTQRYQEVIADVKESFATAAEDASFKFNGTSTKNPFYQFYRDRDYFGASQSLNEKLMERKDPRIEKFFMAHPKNASKKIEFAPNGSPKQSQSFYAISKVMGLTAPVRLLSYHELLFLKAEAYARLNDLNEAELALKAGITAAFAKVGLTQAQAGTYYADEIRGKFVANPIKEIMMQKYLSFYEDEAIENYNDYRRLKAMGNDFVPLSNKGKFPLRFTYGSSDVVTNPNVRGAYGDGEYVYTENVWWAGGTR